MLATVDVYFPEIVYHGTSRVALESFKKYLINPEKWADKKDFGRGFYTTIDLEQAKRWGKRQLEKADEPLVLEIKVDIEEYKRGKFTQYYFLGESLSWAKYILDHRRFATMKNDPCKSTHADIIVGPMADGDTSAIIDEYEQNSSANEIWFYKKITQNNDGKKLTGLQLGNQITFSNPEVARDVLTLKGWYEYNINEERWDYHENS